MYVSVHAPFTLTRNTSTATEIAMELGNIFHMVCVAASNVLVNSSPENAAAAVPLRSLSDRGKLQGVVSVIKEASRLIAH